MNRKGAETELLLISEAVARLEVGMYGNLKQPEPIAKIKEEDKRRRQPRPSIGWGLQKEDAAKRIHEAIMQDKLSVVVLHASTEDVAHRTHLRVPLGVLKQMIRTRGGLPDHAIRPMGIFAKDTTISPELSTALSKSALYVWRKEFDAWYGKARKQQGNWPSQRLRCKKPRMGRPSKQNGLHTPIVALVNEGRWSARQRIADLVRLLQSKGITVTRDTARRTVDQIFKETGEEAYRRNVRRRSKVERGDPKQSNTRI